MNQPPIGRKLGNDQSPGTTFAVDVTRSQGIIKSVRSSLLYRDPMVRNRRSGESTLNQQQEGATASELDSMVQNRVQKVSGFVDMKRTEDDKRGKESIPTSSSALSTRGRTSSRDIPLGEPDDSNGFFAIALANNPEFLMQAAKFMVCFIGLQASYLTWGYMQELIMTTQFEPTPRVPTGKFPSAAFCVFSNRFLAVIVAAIAVMMKHGTLFSEKTAPLWAFTPCALSNTMSSWSQYASLKYVSFPVQTVFKSSKIIPVMLMGKFLKGTSYPLIQYIEATLITFGVAVFSLSSKGFSDSGAETVGLVFLLMYISFDSFTSQWQDKIYVQYGRPNVDQYQMMFGVNVSAICITTAGLIVTGDFPVVWEFLFANPVAIGYNVITAVTSAFGQLFIFYTIKEFGPIVFTIIMTTRQMFSICISAVVFGHPISQMALFGAVLVFSVLFYQIRRKFSDRRAKRVSSGGGQNTQR